MVATLCELTGLTFYESNDLVESMQSMADPADFSASLRTLAITLTRIANDFRLLSSGHPPAWTKSACPHFNPAPASCPEK
jgi:fumarate hydratase, class II